MCCRRLGILKRTRHRENAPRINHSVQCQIKPKTNRFRLYFLHFQGKIERFPTTFAPPEIPKFFLTTCLTTVGAGAIRLVASASVCSAQKTKFKRFPDVPSENLFPCLLRISFCFQFRHTPIQPVGSNNRHFSYASHFHRPCERQSWQNNWSRHRIGTARERR